MCQTTSVYFLGRYQTNYPYGLAYVRNGSREEGTLCHRSENVKMYKVRISSGTGPSPCALGLRIVRQKPFMEALTLRRKRHVLASKRRLF